MAGAFQSDTFQNDAFETGAVTPSFTLDAVLLRTQSTSLTLDAVLRHSQAAGFTLDADLLKTAASSFTVDASIFAAGIQSFSVDAIIRSPQATSFTVDAALQRTTSSSFTVDGLLLKGRSTSLTLDAVLLSAISGSFTLDAVISSGAPVTVPGSFTADAVLKKSSGTKTFTLNAVLSKPRTGSFTMDGYVRPPYVVQHWRTPSHTGVDHDTDHTLAYSFDRYTRGEILQQVLFDLDCRLTTLEQSARHAVCRRGRFPIDAVIISSQSHSFTVDSAIGLRHTFSFSADAFVQPYFTVDAVIGAASSISIQNMQADAVDWGINAVSQSATISTSLLTHEAADPSQFATNAKTGWAYFTLSATTTVQLDTIGSGGDAVIYLYGPGTPTDGNWIDQQDDNVVDATNPHGFSERITQSLAAGTYYVGVIPFSPFAAAFTIKLNMVTI
jgi:hypothetical protein